MQRRAVDNRAVDRGQESLGEAFVLRQIRQAGALGCRLVWCSVGCRSGWRISGGLQQLLRSGWEDGWVGIHRRLVSRLAGGLVDPTLGSQIHLV